LGFGGVYGGGFEGSDSGSFRQHEDDESGHFAGGGDYDYDFDYVGGGGHSPGREHGGSEYGE